MTKDEVLRLALEYVELVPDDRYNAEHIDQDALITAIKAALSGEAQTRSVVKDEPAAWMNKYGACKTSLFRDVEAGAKEEYTIPLYTTPPQRTWTGLTDEDIEQEFGFIDELLRDCVQRTEAKLKEKNT